MLVVVVVVGASLQLLFVAVVALLLFLLVLVVVVVVVMMMMMMMMMMSVVVANSFLRQSRMQLCTKQKHNSAQYPSNSLAPKLISTPTILFSFFLSYQGEFFVSGYESDTFS